MKHLADHTDPQVAPLYADVPVHDLEKFQSFCHATPYKQFAKDRVTWFYLDNANQGETLLLLPGAAAIPDLSWRTIQHFLHAYRVIVPAYPPVKSMFGLVDGIAEILRMEGVEQAHVVGGSYGGLVAQVFVRRHPKLTRSLVLSHTLPPDPVNIQAFRNSIRWLSLLPQGMLRQLMSRRLSTLIPPLTSETALLHALYDEVYFRRLTKQDILSGLRRTADYHAQRYTPQDLENWQGKVLLVMSDDDPATPEAVRSTIFQLYPGAWQHLFHGTGHMTSVLKEQEYLEVIDAFLSDMKL